MPQWGSEALAWGGWICWGEEERHWKPLRLPQGWLIWGSRYSWTKITISPYHWPCRRGLMEREVHRHLEGPDLLSLSLWVLSLGRLCAIREWDLMRAGPNWEAGSLGSLTWGSIIFLGPDSLPKGSAAVGSGQGPAWASCKSLQAWLFPGSITAPSLLSYLWAGTGGSLGPDCSQHHGCCVGHKLILFLRQLLVLLWIIWNWSVAWTCGVSGPLY